jgi:hypothetical protein
MTKNKDVEKQALLYTSRTKKLIRDIENEFSRDRFEVEVNGYNRLFEGKVNRDKMEIVKPDGIRGELIISMLPRPARRGAAPLQLKLNCPNSKAYVIHVPRKFLNLLKEKFASDQRTDLEVSVLCVDHGFEGMLHLHINPKYI